MPECHSTNTVAIQLCQQPSVTEGTLVITDRQTAGRGQRGNIWHSAPGENLTLSVILKPGFITAKNQFFLNIFTSLALYDLISRKTDEPVRVKWPNDILVAGKKICGILIENQIRGTQVSISVTGIGLNVNQTTFALSTATSLAAITNQVYVLPDVMTELMEHLEKRYLQLREQRYDKLRQEYLHTLYWRGEKHLFESNGHTFEGVIQGIDDHGKLCIEKDDHLVTFDIKEIRYLA